MLLTGDNKLDWLLLIAIICYLQISVGCRQSNIEKPELNNWASTATTEEIGNRVANRFLVSPHPYYAEFLAKPHIPYFEVCTWYGALTFAKETGNQNLVEELTNRFEPLLGKDSALRYRQLRQR